MGRTPENGNEKGKNSCRQGDQLGGKRSGGRARLVPNKVERNEQNLGYFSFLCFISYCPVLLSHH